MKRTGLLGLILLFFAPLLLALSPIYTNQSQAASPNWQYVVDPDGGNLTIAGAVTPDPFNGTPAPDPTQFPYFDYTDGTRYTFTALAGVILNNGDKASGTVTVDGSNPGQGTYTTIDQTDGKQQTQTINISNVKAFQDYMTGIGVGPSQPAQDTPLTEVINVDVKINYGRTGTETLAPDTITLLSVDGKNTLDTQPATPPDSWSSSVVEYTGKFSNVAPGTAYKVCSQLLTDAKDPNACVTTPVKTAGSALSVNIVGSKQVPVTSETTVPSDPSGSDTETRCESTGFSLSFVFCPIINGLASTADAIFDHVIVPLLRTGSVKTANDPTDPTYTIWSDFRILGDVILVIGLLIAVFGQSIGGGLIDAYTAKKMLPRILLSAILINLSIYIVAIMVDLTNVVGGGLGSLLAAPLVGAHQNHIVLNGTTSGFGLLGIVGLIFAAVEVVKAKILGIIVTNLLFFVLIPAFLAFMAVMVTLVVRRGIILFLIISSPFAFALYCLPATEKYFRKWWKLLFETLLVYPIVIGVFGIANILAVTIGAANQTGYVSSVVGNIVSIIVLIGPLFFVPYAFKLAGGMIGGLHEFATKHTKQGHERILGEANDPLSRRSNLKRGRQNAILDTRGLINSRLNAPRHSTFVRGLGRGIGGGVAVQQRQAIKNQESAQIIESLWAHGQDDIPKASTIPLSQLDQLRQDPTHARYRIKRYGNRNVEEFMAADGTWFNEGQIREGDRRFGADADHQFNFKKLLEKTEPLEQEYQNYALDDFITWANERNLDSGTAAGRWQGATIPFKHIRLDLRRAQISGTPGHLQHTGTNHQALLTEYAGMHQSEQAKEAPGTFQAIRDSIRTAYNPPPTSSASPAEQARLRETAARAYKNLERFVQGADPAALAAMAAEAPPIESGASPTAPSMYSTSSSVAWKNALAAKQALDDLQTDPLLHSALVADAASIRDIS